MFKDVDGDPCLMPYPHKLMPGLLTDASPIPEDPREPPVRNRCGGLWDDGDGLVPVGCWGHLNESLRSLLVIIRQRIDVALSCPIS